MILILIFAEALALYGLIGKLSQVLCCVLAQKWSCRWLIWVVRLQLALFWHPRPALPALLKQTSMLLAVPGKHQLDSETLRH